MRRFGIFVDAGYLFAQGSALISGEKRDRRLVDLDVAVVQQALLKLGSEKAGYPSFLRTHWYDGAPHGRISATQLEISNRWAAPVCVRQSYWPQARSQ
jgi:hypothetical protein